MPTPVRTIARATGALLAAGAAALAYSTLVEPRMFALRRVDLAVLPPGAWPIRVLHLSDLHIVPGQQRKIDWVSSLADLRPDLVMNTGDTISHPGRCPPRWPRSAACSTCRARSSSATTTSTPRRRSRRTSTSLKKTVTPTGAPLPWRDLRAALAERGWLDLIERRHGAHGARSAAVARRRRRPVHLHATASSRIAGRADPGALLRIGVMHAPEPRVLDLFAGDGYELLLAGHTHGGQVRVPGIGALVTNCDIDRSRARGLSRWGVGLLAQRVRRAGHEPVPADEIRLPTGGHPHHTALNSDRPNRRPIRS